MANQPMDKLREKYEEWHNKEYGDYPDREHIDTRFEFAAYQAAYAQAISEFEQVGVVYSLADSEHFNQPVGTPLYTRKDK